MKVKILHNAYIDDLEKEVNEFIEEIIKDGMKVENISLAYGNNCIKYVLIMYGPDITASFIDRIIKEDEE